MFRIFKNTAVEFKYDGFPVALSWKMLDIFQEIFEVVGSKLTGGKCNLFTNKKVISLFFFFFFWVY